MAKDWIDANKIKRDLRSFFGAKSGDLTRFGSTINQTFEAFVFVSVAKWYDSRGWKVEAVHPVSTSSSRKSLRLKFSTRGRPDNYTYFKCTTKKLEIHVRHQLRVETFYNYPGNDPPANVCLDVAVVESCDLSGFGTNDYVENYSLLSFGEAKHMSAFAELIAGFIGLVHEMMPGVLADHRTCGGATSPKRRHPAPFLYVSGFLFRTALGIKKTIEERGYDIDVYDRVDALVSTSTIPAVKAKRSKP